MINLSDRVSMGGRTAEEVIDSRFPFGCGRVPCGSDDPVVLVVITREGVDVYGEDGIEVRVDDRRLESKRMVGSM